MLPQPSRLPSWRRARATRRVPELLAHVDLKGPKIPFGVFEKLLALYARWGFSGILLEYEHRLPELPVPRQFPASDRYTRAQQKELLRLCAELELECVPLVQTFGHLEYLRRLPETEAMMENPAYPNQLCPCNEQARDYVSRLIASVCAMHPDATRIHVGMDEVHQLGHCPACKRRAKKLGGTLELYLEHAVWVTEQVLQHERTPMIWGDMFLDRGREDLIAQLDPRVQVVPWDYTCVNPASSFVNYKGMRPCKALFRHDYEACSYPRPLPAFPAAGKFADDLEADDLRKMGGLDAESGLGRAFGQAWLMANQGHAVIGVCAAESSPSGSFLPNFFRGMHNCTQTIRSIIEMKGRGAIATAWARGHSFAPLGTLWPLSLYAMAQFAATGWSGKTAPADLKKRAAEIAAELGMPARLGEWSLDDILWVLSNPPDAVAVRVPTLETIRDLLREAKGQGAFAEGLAIAVECSLLSQQLVFLLEEARWWHPNQALVPPMIFNELHERIHTIEQAIGRLKPRARRYYVACVGESASFTCWWEGLFSMELTLARAGLAALPAQADN